MKNFKTFAIVNTELKSLVGGARPEGAGKPDFAVKPEGAGKPEVPGSGKPAFAGKPEGAGKPAFVAGLIGA